MDLPGSPSLYRRSSGLGSSLEKIKVAEARVWILLSNCLGHKKTAFLRKHRKTFLLSALLFTFLLVLFRFFSSSSSSLFSSGSALYEDDEAEGFFSNLLQWKGSDSKFAGLLSGNQRDGSNSEWKKMNLGWRPVASLKDGDQLEKGALKIGMEEESGLDVSMCMVNISTADFYGVLPGKLNLDGHHLCQFALQDSDQSYGMNEYNVAVGDPEKLCWKGWKPSTLGFPTGTLAVGWLKHLHASSSDTHLSSHGSPSFLAIGICRAVVQQDPLVFIPGYLVLGTQSQCIIEFFGKREPTEFQVLIDCH
eukprot:TRINITY_DN11684_c0_g1_i1.p1 TRINITY_DN11684_c0_g1~~TRINITY_DN11684_c0_g1_i1.p1  ORF type:complete len:306 (-),score=126.22 TRINITY_DN11684_c0_g1_i1:140-1057(-)